MTTPWETSLLYELINAGKDKDSIRTVLKNWIINDVTQIKWLWPILVGQDVTSQVKAATEEALVEAKAARAEKSARRHAEEILGKPLDPATAPTVGAVYNHLMSFEAQLNLELDGLYVLARCITQLNRLELIRDKTLFAAGVRSTRKLLEKINKIKTEELTPLAERVSASPGQWLSGDLYTEYSGFHAKNVELISSYIKELDNIKQSLTTGLKSETVKAYVYNQLEKDPDKIQQSINSSLGSLTGALGVAASAASAAQAGTPAKALEAAESVTAAGVACLQRALGAYIISRRTKKIIGNKEQYEKAINALNKDNLAVARYLGDKWVADLEFALELAGPLVTGSNFLAGAALDLSGAGPVAGKFIDLKKFWDAFKNCLIPAARGLQKARLLRVTEKNEQEKGKFSSEDAVKLMQELLEEGKKEIIDSVKGNVFVLAAPVNLMTSVAVRTFMAKLVEKIMMQLKVNPAQEFSGDDLVARIAELEESAPSGIRARRQRLVISDLWAPLRKRIEQTYPYAGFHDSCGGPELTDDEKKPVQAYIDERLAQIRAVSIEAIPKNEIRDLGEDIEKRFAIRIAMSRRAERLEYFTKRITEDQNSTGLEPAQASKLEGLLGKLATDDMIYHKLDIATFPYG